MEEENISYQSLRKIQQLEKNSPVLSDLQNSFYKDLYDYIEILENRLKNEQSSQKKTIISDDLKNIRKISENIYEQREKKIILASISKARGGNPSIKNMINSERELFNLIYDILVSYRKHFFENKKLESNKVEAKKEEFNKNNEVENKNSEVSENKDSIVQVVQDIPEFIGTDKKKYNLKKGDLISLPQNMKDMLIKKNVVDEIDISN